jgi:hypothetical protein
MDEKHQNVRVWRAIHFRNSLAAGDEMGKKIGAHLVSNAFKPMG